MTSSQLTSILGWVQKQYAYSLAALEFRIGNVEACHAHRAAELDRRMHATVHWAIHIISSMPGTYQASPLVDLCLASAVVFNIGCPVRYRQLTL